MSRSSRKNGQSGAASERGRRPSEEAAGARALPRRWWPQHKLEVVLRVLRGESLDAVSRDTRKSPSELARWRDEFLRGGEAALKSRSVDGTDPAADDERRRLQAKVGELSMDCELLREKIRALEKTNPPAWRRSRS